MSVIRPLYETQQDRLLEEACAEKYAAKMGVRLFKLSDQYRRMDRLAIDDKGRHAWLEIKCRKVSRGTYPTLMLSVAKWVAGIQMAQATGGSFVVIAGYTDGIWRYRYRPQDVSDGLIRLEYGGRTTQTRDSGDIEPVMHIPTWMFKRVA